MAKIDAVAVVRRIRDRQYDLTKDQPDEDLKAFFHSEAELANAEAMKLVKKPQQRKQTRPLTRRCSRRSGSAST